MRKIKPISIIADDKIPLVKNFFSHGCNVNLLPGSMISNIELKNADILLIRTITNINEQLLNNTNVSFVGSATSGIDHINHHWLDQKQIAWSHAKGCNALAVAEYVISCIAALQKTHYLPFNHLRVGIIGVGSVGRLVEYYVKQLGASVICNDPPRELRDKHFSSTPLQDFKNLDLICVHSSLTKTGDYPSYHLIDDHFLGRQKSGCVILNAARGAIVANQALKQANHIIPCLDVWEHEPTIDLELLERCVIATPHIAGYSLAAKYRATIMLYQRARQLFDLPKINSSQFMPFPHDPVSLKSNKSWRDDVLAKYDPRDDTKNMKAAFLNNSQETAKTFESLRRMYSLRKEFLSEKVQPNLPATC